MTSDWQAEKREWLEAIDSVLEREGAAGVRDIFRELQDPSGI